MLVLYETPAGFALFNVLDESKLKSSPKDIDKYFSDPKKAQSIVSLKKFYKFEDTLDALDAATALSENKVPESLQKFLQKNIIDEKLNDKLIVSDLKFGNAIKELLNIKVMCDNTTDELIRGIRLQISSLVTAKESDLNAMSIGLSHSYSRYKIKFSPDKVDTMIVQAISLLEDLTSEINIYAMRAREWYGWHFPELGKIINTQTEYAKAIKAMGNRKNAAETDFSAFLPENVCDEVKEAAQISMGTEIAEEDLDHILSLCDQFLSIQSYHTELTEYLRNRMNAIAPNLTILVGEIVGAKLICRAGSLMTLAKYPSSTIQILGAEKAFFRAVKTKHNTPKYGLIYNAKLVNDISAKNKGKMSRVLAAKAALSARFDALCVTSDTSYGIAYKSQLDKRLIQIENGEVIKKTNKNGKSSQPYKKYDGSKSASNPLQTRTVEPSKPMESNITKMNVEKEEKKEKKKEKKVDSSDDEKEKKKDKKKEKKSKKESDDSDDEKEKKKDKKKSKKDDSDDEDMKVDEKKSSKKDKKSKKDDSDDEDMKVDEKKSSKKDKKEEKSSKKDKKEKKSKSSDSEDEVKPKKSSKKDKEEKSSKKDKEEKSSKKDKKRDRDFDSDEKISKKKKDTK